MRTLIGIDSGSNSSGICVVSDGKIVYADNLTNNQVFDYIKSIADDTVNEITVVIEDIKPYAVPLGKQVIDTIKTIGVLQNDLNKAGIKNVSVYRWDVKEWCFKNYRDIVAPRIEQKMIAAEKRKQKEYSDLIEKLDIQDEDYEKKKAKLIKKMNWYRKADGSLKAPTPHYIGDREVIAVMKKHWGIPEPKVGQSNKYGLKDHSWQALAVISVFNATKS